MSNIDFEKKITKRIQLQNQYYENKKILDDSGIKYKIKGVIFIFRNPKKVKVNFYPASNKWDYWRKNKMYTIVGDAKYFLEWYRDKKKSNI